MLTWEVIGNPNITGSDEHNLSFDEKSHVFFFSVKIQAGRMAALTPSTPARIWRGGPRCRYREKTRSFTPTIEDQEHNREAITALMEGLVADPRLAFETDFYAEGNYNVDIYNTPVFRYESHGTWRCQPFTPP